MISVISCTSDSLEGSKLDKRFGRAPWFCLHNSADNSVQFEKNRFLEEENIGLLVIEEFIKRKADRIISGDFGAKVQSILLENNVQMVIFPPDFIMLTELLDKLNN